MSGSHAHIYISYGVTDFFECVTTALMYIIYEGLWRFMVFWGRRGLSGKVEGSYFIEGRALIVHKLIIYYY